MAFHCGPDWSGTSHTVCIIDGVDQVVARIETRYDAAGLIVDALVAIGHSVIPIHPNVLKACRPRYRAAGAKSDPGDAYMLADILRTDGHRFRPLMPASDDIRALRALVCGRDDLVAQRVALANRLRSLLEGFWPGAAAVFAAIDSPIWLSFLARHPTPDSASHLGEKRIASSLAQHAYCGHRSPAELLARLRAAPTNLASEADADAKGELARALVCVLERPLAKIAKLSARIEHAVAELPAGKIVMSFPRAGRINAAHLHVELGDVRERFLTEGHLAAEAGVCPVTHASGKNRRVVFRWACNQNLRLALTCFTDNSRHVSAWAAAIHLKACRCGCSHPHAAIILARAWIRILWRDW